jgi:uncharacterized protein
MIFFFVPMKSGPVKQQQVNPKKVYVLDPGFFWIAATRLSQDLGRVLENLVFIDLILREKTVMYTKGRQETDFLATSSDGHRQVIQVCLDMSDNGTRKRELRSLNMAMEEEELDQGLVVTASEHGEEGIGSRTAHITPFWRWTMVAENDDPYGYAPGRPPGKILHSALLPSGS